MKNLDLNAYGVSEMSHQEMVETDGGGWLANVGVGLAYAGVLLACAVPGVNVLAVASLAVASASLVVAAVESES